MIGKMIKNVRENTPLVHNITNYVTVNDCANAIIAIGGSPIMSDEIKDVKDITSICNALNINIGTLNRRTIKSMYKAGTVSNKLKHPVILDPVGAGASSLRTVTAKNLINKIHNLHSFLSNISFIISQKQNFDKQNHFVCIFSFYTQFYRLYFYNFNLIK